MVISFCSYLTYPTRATQISNDGGRREGLVLVLLVAVAVAVAVAVVVAFIFIFDKNDMYQSRYNRDNTVGNLRFIRSLFLTFVFIFLG